MNLIEKLKSDPRFYWEIILLLCMYGAYAVLNICRMTVVTSSPAMLDDPELGLNKTMWGAILGWGTAGTLVGKLVTGIMADRFGGRRSISIFYWLLYVGNRNIWHDVQVFYFSIAFFIAMFAKSAGWPSMANLIRAWFPKDWRGESGAFFLQVQCQARFSHLL